MKRIRGHHLFCMPLFSGHGYSETFSGNMAAVIEALKDGEPFRLCDCSDRVCTACPNLKREGGCALGTADVQERDRAAFRVLGLRPEEECTWSLMMDRLRRISPEDFRSVCGGCRWSREGLCSFSLLMERVDEAFLSGLLCKKDRFS